MVVDLTAIVIGGTPGTGKTEVARILGSLLSVEVVSLGSLAREAGCISEMDLRRNTGVINEDCLVEAIIELLDKKRGRIIIEGHYIDLVPSSDTEWVFVLRTHPETLKTRLASRGYLEDKVKENVEAEVIGVCQMDAIESFGEERVIEVDTTGQSAKDTANEIMKIINGATVNQHIDWMEMLEEEGRLDQFLS